MRFPVYQIPERPETDPEYMGTRRKFWFRDPVMGRVLWKEARGASGEDWSEKIACEIARGIGLPCATYELAESGKKHGTISPVLLRHQTDANGRYTPLERLVHGNELLWNIEDEYPIPGDDRQKFRNTAHTVHRVWDCLGIYEPGLPRGFAYPNGIATAWDLFVGYLMLDALIGNTDRHHENWAVIEWKDENDVTIRTLAPTYDHASCLGCHETDATRLRRLHVHDRGNVANWAARARSALYRTPGDKKPLTTREAFVEGMKRGPDAARIWVSRLESWQTSDIIALFSRLPADRITPTTAEFAAAMLRENQKWLLGAAQMRWM